MGGRITGRFPTADTPAGGSNRKSSGVAPTVWPMGRITDWLLGVQPDPTPELEAQLVPQGVGDYQVGMLSPFQPEPHFNQLVWQDVMGRDLAPMSRAVAMRIPALARMRHLVAGTVARCPLQVWNRDQLVPEQPSWTSRTDYGLPPYHRMLWTVDDLIFHGWSLWVRRNAAATDGGRPLELARVAKERWSFDGEGRVVVDGSPVTRDQVVLIPGPHEGVLTFGAEALRQAADLAANAAKAAKNPNAYVNLHYTGDRPQERSEIVQLVADWAAARRGENGGVAYTSKNVEAIEMGAAQEHLLVEGRNAAAVDVARLVGGPASMVDATTNQASLTYETTTGRNAQFIDYGVSLYMDPIAARLSMDDIVARGESVRFDTSVLRDPAPSPTGPATED